MDPIRGHYAELDRIAQELGVSLPSKDAAPSGARANGDETPPPAAPAAAAAVSTVRRAALDIDASVEPAFRGQAPAPGSDDLAAAQGDLSGSLTRAALSVQDVQEQLRTLGAEAGGTASRLVDWLLNHVMRVVSKVAGTLHVDSWSIGVTGGFPAGVNVSITVTFK